MDNDDDDDKTIRAELRFRPPLTLFPLPHRCAHATGSALLGHYLPLARGGGGGGAARIRHIYM
jgi:hypothetical protein